MQPDEAVHTCEGDNGWMGGKMYGQGECGSVSVRVRLHELGPELDYATRIIKIMQMGS